MRKHSPQYVLEALGIDQSDSIAKMLSRIVWGCAVEGRPCYVYARAIADEWHISDSTVWRLIDHLITDALERADDLDPFVTGLFEGRSVKGAVILMAEELRGGRIDTTCRGASLWPQREAPPRGSAASANASYRSASACPTLIR